MALVVEYAQDCFRPILRVVLESERVLKEVVVSSFFILRYDCYFVVGYQMVLLLLCCWLSNGVVVTVTVNSRERGGTA